MREQLHRDIERQLVEEGGAVVGRQRVEQGGGLRLTSAALSSFFCASRRM
jgi:hypothetical protein